MNNTAKNTITKIDLRPDHLQQVQTILRRHLPEQVSVWAFGSRANRTAKEYSDLDLALDSPRPIEETTITNLRLDFEQSDLPWKVNPVNLAEVSPEFRKVVDRDKVPLPFFNKINVAVASVTEESPPSIKPVMSFDMSSFSIPLPDGWSYKRISDVAQINANTITKRNAPDNICYIDISSVHRGSFKKPKKITYADAPSRAKRRLQKNDFLISTVRPNLKQYTFLEEVGSNWVASTGFCVVTPKDEKFAWYLYSVITSDFFNEHLIRVADGAAYPAFKAKDIENAIIFWPDETSLNTINDLTKSLNKKIGINFKLNKTLEAIARAIFKSWFVDFDPVRAKIAVLEAGGTTEEAQRAAMAVLSSKTPEQLARLQDTDPQARQQLHDTAALFPAALQPSELGDIPEGWEVGTIGQSYKVVMGQSPKGNTYNECQEGTLFYQGRAEFGWRFPNPRLYTTEPKRMAAKGDVLMSVRAPVGDLNISLEDCCIGRGLCALRHNSGSMSLGYYQLKQLTSYFDTYNGEGTVFGSIKQKDLKSIPCLNPSDKLAKAYSSVVEKIDKKIELRNREAATLANARNALLPKLLSGELNIDSQQQPFQELGNE